MRLKHLVLILAVLLGISIYGCSRNGEPTSPSGSNGNLPGDDNSNYSPSSPDKFAATAGHFLWTYQEIFFNTHDLSFKMIPLKEAQAHYNVLMFLEDPACKNCVSILGATQLGVDTYSLTLQLIHPIPSLDWTGFDVRGIGMFSGNKTFPGSGLITSDSRVGDPEITNADGYTTLYNPKTAGAGDSGIEGYQKGDLSSPTVPNSTLNVFKRFISAGAANTRNAFYGGDAVTVVYEAKLPPGDITFGYAVDASYEPPAKSPVTNPMTDFALNANCSEPWKLEVSQAPVGLGLIASGGSTKLTVNVFSWQPGDFDVNLEIPELFDGVRTTDVLTDSGAGFKSYDIMVDNAKLATPGDYRCLVSAKNKQNPVVPSHIDLTSYQIVSVTVNADPPTPLPPVAFAKADMLTAGLNVPIHFTDNGSYDPDGGAIALYEWDWDNDGVFDATGSDVYHSWSAVGNYSVQFRVTDNEGDSTMLAAPIDITINDIKFDPVALAKVAPTTVDIGVQAHFQDNGSNDPDGGTITLYEWDWDNDGVFDETGSDLYHSWTSAGIHYVQFRVTDDEGATATLASPLSVTVNPPNQAPTALAKATPLTAQTGVQIHFQDNGSSDPDGTIVLYEWDWDNNGTFDATGADVYHTWASAGNYSVQMRVTDNDGATATLTSPLSITVTPPNQAPNALAKATPTSAQTGVQIHFQDNGSSDPDGTITSYEWDWDNNGTYDASGADVYHTWATAGIYNVQMRVTDNGGLTDTLSAPLSITITAPPVTWNNTIAAMLAANCGSCHIGGGGSGGLEMSTYANVIAAGVINKGSPTTSKLYTKIYQNNHYGKLTAPQLSTLYDWILNNAPEN
jgi:PKD repeat protein